jgi:hypothetical protein
MQIKSSINAVWHKKHKMPANPSFEERMKWHIAHAKHCGCRPIPPKLKAEIKKFEKEKARKN